MNIYTKALSYAFIGPHSTWYSLGYGEDHEPCNELKVVLSQQIATMTATAMDLGYINNIPQNPDYISKT